MLVQMDEVDYDVRMVAYQQLLPGAWAAMERWQALPLLHQALADLRDADDLALRHAAAQVPDLKALPRRRALTACVIASMGCEPDT